jgi:hypothetical protein
MACMMDGYGLVWYGGFRSSLALAWLGLKSQVSRSKPALIPIGRSFPHPRSSLSSSISSFSFLLLLHPLHDSALAIAGPRSSPHLTFSFIASTDSAIPFGSITLLRLYSLHSVTLTHAPSTEPHFRIFNQQISTSIPFFSCQIQRSIYLTLISTFDSSYFYHARLFVDYHTRNRDHHSFITSIDRPQ